MQKSVYSIVLSDDVVACIDRLAYANGTSRSNMINQILAEHVSYTTPEKRRGDIFSKAVEMINAMDQLQVMLRPSDTLLSVKSALSYKYNPTVRYSIELYKNSSALGQLRVTLRTQNASLVALMNNFFALWTQIEAGLSDPPQAEYGEGKYSRMLRRPDSADEQAIARAIVSYVETMDTAMKSFFSDMGRGLDPSSGAAKIYSDYANKSTLLL